MYFSMNAAFLLAVGDIPLVEEMSPQRQAQEVF